MRERGAEATEGGDGTRAPPVCGFGVILFALGFPSLLTWAYFVLLADAAPWLQQSVYGLGKAVQFGLPLAWVLWVLRRRVRPGLPRVRGMGIGAVFALVTGGTMFWLYEGLLAPSGLMAEPARLVRAKVEAFGIEGGFGFAVLGALYSLVHSLAEEYYWRWFVFGELDRRLSRITAILVSSLGFTAHHVIVLSHYLGGAGAMAYVTSAGVAIGGAVWAWLYARSGSLYAVWLSHGLVDAAIFAIGYRMVIG